MKRRFRGFSIALIPFSWEVGIWHKSHKKSVYACGPFRFVIHRDMGEWKEAKPPGPGKWLHGASRSEYIGNDLDGRIEAGGALEPTNHPVQA